MKNIVIRAPLLSCSGYGVHSRQIFKWLISREDLQVKTQVVPWGETNWWLNEEYENGLIGEVFKRSANNNDTAYDISFQVQLPNEWDPNLAKFNLGVSAVVETDKCNPAWIDACNKMDAVIVPTAHVKNTLENTGEIKVPLLVIPESYIESIDEDPDPLGLDISTNFNFLLVGQITGNNPENDRKNLFYTIKWMCDVFKDDPDVGIILKTNSGTGSKIDRKVTTRLITQLTQEARQGKFPKLYLVHGNLKSEEIAQLYREPSIKCLVSLTRGEGFGLPLLEAAASRIPIIATRWSGHLDFLKLGKFISVDYRLVDIHESRVDNRIFMPGSKWAEANEGDFKRRISKFRKSSAIPTQWAQELSENIRSNFSHRAISKIYDKALKELVGI